MVVCTGVFVAFRRRLLLVEWGALAVFVVVFIGMFESAVSNPRYSYFPFSFLALLLGICAGRVYGALVPCMGVHVSSTRGGLGRFGKLVAAGGAVAVAIFFVSQGTAYGHSYLAEASDPSAQIDSVIPAGACVVSDYYVDLLAANRFTSVQPGCPDVVDPFGMYLAEDDGNPPHVASSFPVAFVLQWFSYLQAAQYVELKGPFNNEIPWTRTLIYWFQSSYTLAGRFTTIYPRAGPFDSYKAEWIYRTLRRGFR